MIVKDYIIYLRMPRMPSQICKNKATSLKAWFRIKNMYNKESASRLDPKTKELNISSW